jgi:glycogen debranching enzyme
VASKTSDAPAPWHRPDFLIRLRPWEDLICVSQGRTVLGTERDGFFDGGPNRGLFVHQTRLVSRYRYFVDGLPPRMVAGSNVAQHTWLGYFVIFPPGQDPGERDHGSGHVEPESEQTLELLLARYVGGGLHEDADLTNFSRHTLSFTLSIEVDADFADQGETLDPEDGGKDRPQGQTERRWNATEPGGELIFEHRAEHDYDHPGERGTAQIHRRLTLRVSNADSPPSWEDGRLTFQVTLPPGGTWHACLDFLPEILDLPDDGLLPNYGCRSFHETDNEHDRRRNLFLEEAASFATPESDTLSPIVITALEQARRDLASLRLHDLDGEDHAWTVAAGLPLFVSLYGRDALTAAWQGSLLGPEMMQGSLQTLAHLQGKEINDWRDEQPGRMIHEAHTGPLPSLDLNPRGRSYGSVTTSGFYPLVLAELWHWTGDRERIRPLIGPALDSLRWLERFSERDGFFEYKTRSPQGVIHQGWKDSADAIVDEDGRPVEPPIATCEEQGFVHVAKLHFSELLWWLGEKDEAKRLFHEAGELKARFNETFWQEDLGFYALGLDAQRRPIRAITSNPGHCLAAGIADKELARRTAERLFAPDLYSGWGIRTLSADNPAFNPYSYHRGSVWPVEHGSFALGLMRFGLHEELERICLGMFEAARLFDFYRLPEAFSGHTRDDDHAFPALYRQANSPQAWSASAVFCMVQSLLGLYPYAPLDLLLVDPRLPAWLPEITIRGLRVGKATVTLRFFRKGTGQEDSTDYEILDLRGKLHVLRQPSPWSLTATFAERLKDALTSLLPGR